MKFYQKPQDDLVLSEIKSILNQRPSYGYKRVTSLINRKRKENRLKPWLFEFNNDPRETIDKTDQIRPAGIERAHDTELVHQ